MYYLQAWTQIKNYIFKQKSKRGEIAAMHSFKIISSVTLLIIIIFAFSNYSNHILTTTSQNIESRVGKIEENIKSGNWDLINDQLEDLEKDWNKIGKSWAILIDHFEIDNIDNSFTRMSKYIEAREFAPALAEAGALKQFIKHIPEKDEMKIKNIF